MSNLYDAAKKFDTGNGQYRIDVTDGNDHIKIIAMFMEGDRSSDAVRCATNRLYKDFAHHVKPYGRCDLHPDSALFLTFKDKKVSDVTVKLLLEKLTSLLKLIAKEDLT